MNANQATMNKIATIKDGAQGGAPTLKLRLRPEPSLNDICYERIKDTFYHGVYGDTSSAETCFRLVIDKRTGFFNATKMCQIGGKEFKKWTRLEGTKQLIRCVEEDQSWGPDLALNSGPTYEVFEGSNNDQLNKQVTGTYVCKELILSLASWISPAFYLRCSRIVNDYFIPKNQKTVNDPEELNKVLKQLEALRLENEANVEIIKEKNVEISDLKEMLLRAEQDRLEDRKKAEEQHRLLLSVGIRMEDLIERNDALIEKNEELDVKVVSVQKKLNIAVEDRAPQPDLKAQRERFILLRSNEMDLPFHVIRAQEAGARKTLKRYQTAFSDVVVLVDLLCHPNSKTYYNRVKEVLKQRGVRMRFNDISLEGSTTTEEQLIQIIHDVDAEKRAVE